MAARRIKLTTNNKYTQTLKLRTGRKLVITPNNDYNSIMFTTQHRAVSPKEYQLNLWAKFAQDSFDGIHIKSFIEKDSEVFQSTNYTFDIYTVDKDSNWAETLVATKSGVPLGDGSFKCHVTSSEFPSTVDLDGEITLAIRSTCFRMGRKYTKKIFINHMGVYDSIVRLRQDIEFLDITKLDE